MNTCSFSWCNDVPVDVDHDAHVSISTEGADRHCSTANWPIIQTLKGIRNFLYDLFYTTVFMRKHRLNKIQNAVDLRKHNGNINGAQDKKFTTNIKISVKTQHLDMWLMTAIVACVPVDPVKGALHTHSQITCMRLTTVRLLQSDLIWRLI